MKLFKNKFKASPNKENLPEISSLKDEDLWTFIQKPQGENAEEQVKDLEDLWAKAKEETARMSSGPGLSGQNWAISLS